MRLKGAKTRSEKERKNDDEKKGNNGGEGPRAECFATVFMNYRTNRCYAMASRATQWLGSNVI